MEEGSSTSNWRDLLILIRGDSDSGKLASKAILESINNEMISLPTTLPDLFHEIVIDYVTSDIDSTRNNAAHLLRLLCASFSKYLYPLISESKSDGEIMSKRDIKFIELIKRNDCFLYSGNDSPSLSEIINSSVGGKLYMRSWLSKQREEIQKRLGLELSSEDAKVADKYDSSNIIDDEDLLPFDSTLHLINLANKISSVRSVEKEVSADLTEEIWFARLIRYMIVGLMDKKSDVRIGCSLGLSSIINGLRSDNKDDQSFILPSFLCNDIVCYGLSVLVFDKYIDFGGDSVEATIAPVKNEVSKLIMFSLNCLNQSDTNLFVFNFLQEMALYYDNNSNNNCSDCWSFRYSGVLGLKYYIIENYEIFANKYNITSVMSIIKLIFSNNDIDDIIIESSRLIQFLYVRVKQLFDSKNNKIQSIVECIDVDQIIGIIDLIASMINNCTEESFNKIISLSECISSYFSIIHIIIDNKILVWSNSIILSFVIKSAIAFAKILSKIYFISDILKFIIYNNVQSFIRILNDIIKLMIVRDDFDLFVVFTSNQLLLEFVGSTILMIGTVFSSMLVNPIRPSNNLKLVSKAEQTLKVKEEGNSINIDKEYNNRKFSVHESTKVLAINLSELLQLILLIIFSYNDLESGVIQPTQKKKRKIIKTNPSENILSFVCAIFDSLINWLGIDNIVVPSDRKDLAITLNTFIEYNKHKDHLVFICEDFHINILELFSNILFSSLVEPLERYKEVRCHSMSSESTYSVYSLSNEMSIYQFSLFFSEVLSNVNILGFNMIDKPGYSINQHLQDICRNLNRNNSNNYTFITDSVYRSIEKSILQKIDRYRFELNLQKRIPTTKKLKFVIVRDLTNEKINTTNYNKASNSSTVLTLEGIIILFIEVTCKSTLRSPASLQTLSNYKKFSTLHKLYLLSTSVDINEMEILTNEIITSSSSCENFRLFQISRILSDNILRLLNHTNSENELLLLDYVMSIVRCDDINSKCAKFLIKFMLQGLKINFIKRFSQEYISSFSGINILLFLEGLTLDNIYFDSSIYDALLDMYNIVDLVSHSLSSLSIKANKEETIHFINVSATILHALITYEVTDILELRRDSRGSLLFDKVLSAIQLQLNSKGSKARFRIVIMRLFSDLVFQLQKFILPSFDIVFNIALHGISDNEPTLRQLCTSVFRIILPMTLLGKDSCFKNNSMENIRIFDIFSKSNETINLSTKKYDQEIIRTLNNSTNLTKLLRSYQWEGISWLTKLRRNGLSGILADEMGLGKSLQALVAIAIKVIETNDYTSSSLIICPASLILHWESEIKKFFSGKLLIPIRYSKQAMNDIIKSTISSSNKVIIVSYDVMRNEQHLISQYLWSSIILDEAHLIRNPKTLTAQSVFSLKSQFRILLTGTPIQNQIEDLWSMMNFLLPDYLGNYAEFQKTYVRKILKSMKESSLLKETEKKYFDSNENKSNSSRPNAIIVDPVTDTIRNKLNKSIQISTEGISLLKQLHKQVLPFILRRMKSAVAKELPTKTIIDLYSPLSDIQRQMYNSFQDNLRVSDEQLEKEVIKSRQNKNLIETMTNPTADSNSFGNILDGFKAKNNNNKVAISTSSKMNPFKAINYLKFLSFHPALVISIDHTSYRNRLLNDLSCSGKMDTLLKILIESGVIMREEFNHKDYNYEDLFLNSIGEEKKKILRRDENDLSDDEDLVESENPKFQVKSTNQDSSNSNNNNSQVGVHRCLIFGQYKMSLDIVENIVLKRYFPVVNYRRLDGDTPPSKRSEIAHQFNSQSPLNIDISDNNNSSDESGVINELKSKLPNVFKKISDNNNSNSKILDIRILLMTTRSCGLGLNLTAADTVIFLEHDWNPSVDLQGMDRVHRIGQNNPVTIYRIIAESTIEQRIIGLQEIKQDISNIVINEDNASSKDFGNVLVNSLKLGGSGSTNNSSEDDDFNLDEFIQSIGDV